ncbi:hypothetical protein [Mycolicibacterium arseniciresistens]|uniref:Uncharacterized protein n=1 Tax=Mycolicibacterium arseniciresistens TaxID=3062257 RepID=A0ABT8UKS4_9MYCO|nr:hypothetical protein [Mycolicibacterium arseniciresistens]MDO3637647.1 hypothetical protein [Mycolicibacterium arseniciresistens]
MTSPAPQPVPHSPSRRIGRSVVALAVAAVGVVAGWLLVTGVLALPLREGVLLALSGLAAAALLAGAVLVRHLWVRALLAGGFLGVTASLALVLLVVAS